MVVHNFLTVYVLTDRTPTGRKTRNTRISGDFWARTALGTYRNPGPGPKTKNRNFPVLGVPKRKKKLLRYPGWLSATILHFMFWPTGPPWAGNRKIRGFWAILAYDGPWHLKKFWARAENGKTQFPGARSPGIEKKVTTLYPGWLSATFLCFTFCPTRPPRAGNRKIRIF